MAPRLTRFIEYKGEQIPVKPNGDPMYVTIDARKKWSITWSYAVPQEWRVPDGRNGSYRQRSRTFSNAWDAALERAALERRVSKRDLTLNDDVPPSQSQLVPVGEPRDLPATKRRRTSKKAPPHGESSGVNCLECGAAKPRAAAMCGMCSSGRTRRVFAYANVVHGAKANPRQETGDADDQLNSTSASPSPADLPQEESGEVVDVQKEEIALVAVHEDAKTAKRPGRRGKPRPDCPSCSKGNVKTLGGGTPPKYRYKCRDCAHTWQQVPPHKVHHGLDERLALTGFDEAEEVLEGILVSGLVDENEAQGASAQVPPTLMPPPAARAPALEPAAVQMGRAPADTSAHSAAHEEEVSEEASETSSIWVMRAVRLLARGTLTPEMVALQVLREAAKTSTTIDQDSFDDCLEACGQQGIPNDRVLALQDELGL
mmetsp:Transcript_23723/g.51151  ORF Transcript_23723/g.51151 Transcript_23723/m.51151 type:complete len:429 (-) Transcript_23723:269-1555(-)